MSNGTLLLILNLCNQRPNMWLQLDGKLITRFQEFLGVFRGSHARRSTGLNDGPGGQGGSLREEAD